MKTYIGHPLQVRGMESYRLEGGRGHGMHFLVVRNGLGLELWISLDRCGDLSRVTFKGDNMGYFSPCGYVAPTYYDKNEFLRSFTAGFFTTCGLTAVGSPCEDEGESLPLHGTVANIPAEFCGYDESEEGITVRLLVRDAVIFGRKLLLQRNYTVSYRQNTVRVEDCVHNEGDTASPYMILYHCNMGYPLLTENSQVVIPHEGVKPRNEHAARFLAVADQMERPQAGYEECCYYYNVKESGDTARVGIFGKEINKGVVLSYDKRQLPCFTEWKMMGQRDYVLGLEPGNCTPDGRDVMRRNGTLRFLAPDEIGTTALTFTFADSRKIFEEDLSCSQI